MSRIRITLAALALAGAAAATLAAPSRGVSPCTVTWDGGGTSRTWAQAANWSADTLPATGDVVCIGALTGSDTVLMDTTATVRALRSDHPLTLTGTLTLSDGGEPSGIASLRLTGTLAGASTATLGGLDWSTGGTLTGTGRTVVTGATTISHGSGWDGTYINGGRVLETQGATSWVNGRVHIARDGIWENGGAVTTGTEWPSGVYHGGGSGTDEPLLHNKAGATFAKTSGGGRTEIMVPVRNAGEFKSTSGFLGLDAGSAGTSGGSFTGTLDDAGTQADETAWVAFGGTAAHTLDGSTFTNLRVDGGRLVVPAGRTVSGTGMQVTSGGRVGGDAGGGTVTVAGRLDWAINGAFDGAGTTISTGDLRVALGSCWDAVSLNRGHVLRTEGTGTWSCGRIHGVGNGVWQNAGTISVTSTWPSRMIDDDAGADAGPVLHNLAAGVFATTGSSPNSEIFWRVDNDGRMREDTSQRLELRGGDAGVSAGNTGATLADGTFRIGAGARADGLRIAGGTADVQPGAEATSTGMHLESGHLGGTGTLDVTGRLWWSGGRMSNTGTTRVTGTLDVDTGEVGWNSVHLDEGRTLRTEGTGTYSRGRLWGAKGALWQNSGNIRMNFEWPSQMYEDAPDGQPLPQIHNLAGGTFRKTSGTGTSDVYWAFENDGRTAEQCTPADGEASCTPGQLRLHSGGGGDARVSTGNHGATLWAGTFVGGDGAAYDDVEIASSATVDQLAGTSATSDGMTLSGGTLGGGGTVTVGGTLRWSGGSMAGDGLTRVTGHLSVDTGEVGWNSMYLRAGRRLRTEGTTTYSRGRLWGGRDAVWENAGTATINPEWPGQMYEEAADGETLPRLHNLAGGVLRKTQGGGTTDLYWAVENDGTTSEPSACTPPEGQSSCSVGQLRLHSGGGAALSTGTHGATLSGGTFPHGDGGRLDGAEVAGGVVSIPAGQTVTGGHFWITGGGIDGAGTLTVDGTLEWQGGEMNGSGLTRVTGELKVNGGDWTSVWIGPGRTLRTEGTGTWTRTRIHGRSGAVWENTGSFDANAEWPGYLAQDHGSGTPAVLRNSGTMTKTAGGGTTEIHWPVENQGVLKHTSGGLRFHSGGVGQSGGAFGGTLLGGTFVLADGASLDGARLEGATVRVPDGATARTGTMRFLSGSIRGLGTLLVDKELVWTNGNMEDAGQTVVARDATLQLGENTWTSVSLAPGRRLENHGLFRWTSGSLWLPDRSTFENAGTLEIRTNGETMAASGGAARGELVNTGTIVRAAGTGTTYINTIVNDGTVRLPRGVLSVERYQQTRDGRLEIGIGGTSPGTGHGQLASYSGLRLAGTLRAVVDDGYAPADGDAHNVVSAGTHTGDFTSLEGVDLGGGASLSGAWQPWSGYHLTAEVSPAPARAPVAPVAEPEPEPEPERADPAPAEAGTGAVIAADDSIRLLPGQAARLLANDTAPAGTLVELVGRPRGVAVGVRVDRRTGVLRVRRGRSAARRLTVRYRLVAADGRRSGVATVRIRLLRAARRAAHR